MSPAQFSLPTHADIADKAADELEAHGHTKHALRDFETGAMCYLGALNKAMTGSAIGWVDEVRPIADVSAGLLGLTPKYDSPWGPLDDVVDWNNANDTKPEEVVQLLRDTAIKLRTDEMTVTGEH